MCSYKPLHEPISYIENVGNNLIYSVEITINSYSIDKQYGSWMTIWNELTLPEGKRQAYNNMVNADTFGGTYTTPILNNIVSGTNLTVGNILVAPQKNIYTITIWFVKIWSSDTCCL